MVPEGPLPRRRVTFQEPVEEPSLGRNVEDHMMEPPVSNLETWLEWQAKQLGTIAWQLELKAILGVKDPQKLACKIRASFYIPEVRMRASPNQQYTALPAPKCLRRNAFILDELSYQDVHQQPTLLTVTYARGLLYWVEKLNPPRSPDLCHLVGSIVELREAMQEHVTFNHWDIVQGLGAIHLGSTSRWPQTTLFSCILRLPAEGQDFIEATTPTTLSTAEEDTTRCTMLPPRTEGGDGYLFVVTTSVGQLNLGPHGDGPEGSRAENTLWNQEWLPHSLALPRQSVMKVLL